MRVVLLVLLLQAVLFSSATFAKGKYMSVDDFISQGFAAPAKPAVLWLDKSLKQKAADILQHDYAGLRQRYWLQSDRSAWVLEEVGKEWPITFGVIVEGGQIADIKVLEFRESRGGEVRHNFFTKQFLGLGLDAESDLNGRIDGITGATLSVNAMKKVARLALLFDKKIQRSIQEKVEKAAQD
jgi:hypothetical protein